MKIALIGYGKMGKEIEITALERNHELALVIDVDNQHEFTVDNLKKADVAIDFSTPGSAFRNILKSFEAGIPIVCGTTGWFDKLEEVKTLCERQNHTFFYASNFSPGMNIFMALNKHLARVMNNMPTYDVEMKEIHHIHKVDAPSGTAITLANDLIAALHRKQKWELNETSDNTVVKITALREGEVPGTHIVIWDSPMDRIEILHEAKSRKGFALGAILAAEFIKDKTGIFSMADLVKF
jgi:4-hydroxy-tetrahydrodipicolinate reductase